MLKSRILHIMKIHDRGLYLANAKFLLKFILAISMLSVHRFSFFAGPVTTK